MYAIKIVTKSGQEHLNNVNEMVVGGWPLENVALGHLRDVERHYKDLKAKHGDRIGDATFSLVAYATMTMWERQSEDLEL